jgi:hypothetical protein
MEGIRRAVLLILAVAAVSSSSGLEIGGSVSYDRLAGDFGRDYGGGTGFAAVLGTRLSPTQDLAVVAHASRFPGDGNGELKAWLRGISLRFRLFPVEGKPYFVAYSISLFNLRRSLSDRFEEASYPGLGLGGGIALPVTSQIRLSLALSLSRVLAEARSGSVVSIDAYFARHF